MLQSVSEGLRDLQAKQMRQQTTMNSDKSEKSGMSTDTQFRITIGTIITCVVALGGMGVTYMEKRDKDVISTAKYQDMLVRNTEALQKVNEALERMQRENADSFSRVNSQIDAQNMEHARYDDRMLIMKNEIDELKKVKR